MAINPLDDIIRMATKAWGGAAPKKATKKVASKVSGKAIKKPVAKKGAKPAVKVPRKPGGEPSGGAKVPRKPKPKKPSGGSSKAPLTKDNKLIQPIKKKPTKGKAVKQRRMTPQEREVARREKFESMPRAGKIAKVPPRRPVRGNISGKRAVPKGEAEQREAIRQANRLLRMSGGKPAPRTRQGVEKPVEVKGSVAKTTKRSKSQPMGPSSSYEADILRRLAAADRRRIR